jgi:PleD family two-component response regulator
MTANSACPLKDSAFPHLPGAAHACPKLLGLAVYPTHGMDALALIKQADKAMYQAKISGKPGARSFAG